MILVLFHKFWIPFRCKFSATPKGFIFHMLCEIYSFFLQQKKNPKKLPSQFPQAEQNELLSLKYSVMFALAWFNLSLREGTDIQPPRPLIPPHDFQVLNLEKEHVTSWQILTVLLARGFWLWKEFRFSSCDVKHRANALQMSQTISFSSSVKNNTLSGCLIIIMTQGIWTVSSLIFVPLCAQILSLPLTVVQVLLLPRFPAAFLLLLGSMQMLSSIMNMGHFYRAGTHTSPFPVNRELENTVFWTCSQFSFKPPSFPEISSVACHFQPCNYLHVPCCVDVRGFRNWEGWHTCYALLSAFKEHISKWTQVHGTWFLAKQRMHNT